LADEKQTIFLRQATGLVRTFGVADAIWTNLSLVGIFFSLTFVASEAPLIGGDPLLGGLIALVGMFFVALAFSAVSILTPRTAGDYVFTSRYLHPALGFVGNAGYFVATVPLFMGITIGTIESFGFSSLFGYLGLLSGNQGLVTLATALETTPAYEFALGGGLTVIFGLLPFFGYRIYRGMNNVVLPLILIAVAVMFAVLVATPSSTALADLARLSGHANLTSTITAAGTPPPQSGWGNAFALNAVYVVGFSYIISAVYISGEVRQIKRNMPLAIMGTLLITLVIFAGSILLSYHAFGYGYLSNLYTYSSSSFPIYPYLDFLAAAISPNVYVGSFIIIVAIIQLLWYQTNAVFIGGRLLLSYSFDRIMPSFMGDVSERFHGPVKAMIVSLVIGLLSGIIFTFLLPVSVTFDMSSAAVAILMLFPITVVGVALLTFRFARKAEFKSSSLANSFLGGPIYIIAAVVTIGYILATFYEYVTVPAVYGAAANSVFGYETIFIPIVVLFVIYYVAKYVNQSRGVKFDLIFKEIPPE
jgi:glutamate:GABA antiporter